jgi:hypothetical protein
MQAADGRAGKQNPLQKIGKLKDPLSVSPDQTSEGENRSEYWRVPLGYTV